LGCPSQAGDIFWLVGYEAYIVAKFPRARNIAKEWDFAGLVGRAGQDLARGRVVFNFWNLIY
jgi:hypothetical protein